MKEMPMTNADTQSFLEGSRYRLTEIRIAPHTIQNVQIYYPDPEQDNWTIFKRLKMPSPGAGKLTKDLPIS